MKENEFVIGKWYKFTSYGNCKNNYAKCIETNYIFKGSPWIYNGELRDLGGWNYSNMTDIEEADMSEVSKFLPDGHKDKVVGLPEEYIVEIADYNEWVKLKDNKIMKEEFKLPEKWCIIKDKQEICDWFVEKYHRDYSLNSRNDEYIHYPEINSMCIFDNIREGYKEITYEQFKKYVMNKVEAPKTFLVKGDSKHLLKACLDEILKLGYKILEKRELKNYFCSDLNTVNSNTTIKEYKNIFINSDLLTNPKADIIFTLPQDYSKAIEHAKSALESDYWTQSKVKKMKFGELEVEVTPGLGYVQIAEGKVTKEDLKKVIDWFENRPKLLGYELTFKADKTIGIAFGCKRGIYPELLAIYEAM